MGTHVVIEHRTAYAYDRPVRLGPHLVRLRPTPHARMPVLSYELSVEPSPDVAAWQQDPFGNLVARYVVDAPTDRLELRVELVADVVAHNPFDFLLDPVAATWPVQYDDRTARDLQPYLATVEQDASLDAFVDGLRAGPAADGRGTTDVLVDLTTAVHEALAYEVRDDPGVQPPEVTLARRAGSCRDSAWLLVLALRRLGVAARFVSGYLVELALDAAGPDAASGTGEDRAELHAWVECWLPGPGWLGLDPTSGLLAGEGHLPLACTREPSAAAPVEGTVGPAAATLTHEVRLRRVGGAA